jgi:hypothetical protein
MRRSHQSQEQHMSKHTPGPWDYYLEPSDHYKHKIRSKPGLICQLPGWVTHDELRLEQEANARLIVAAPELLEALGTLLNRLEGIGGEHVTGMEGVDADLMKANAAIAKATGEHHDN